MKGLGIFLIIVAIAAFILCISYGSSGFDKIMNYEKGYDWGHIYHNNYVEEDEYNYIINSNYFIGFSILGGCCGIAGIIALCFGGYLYCKGKSKDDNRSTFGSGIEKLYDEKTGMWKT